MPRKYRRKRLHRPRGPLHPAYRASLRVRDRKMWQEFLDRMRKRPLTMLERTVLLGVLERNPAILKHARKLPDKLQRRMPRNVVPPIKPKQYFTSEGVADNFNDAIDAMLRASGTDPKDFPVHRRDRSGS